MRWTTAMTLALAVAVALPLTAAAEGKGHGREKGPGGGPKGGIDADDAVEAVTHAAFSELERQLIHEFFGVGYAGGGGGLPPGLRKQLDQRGALPPGLSGRPLPPGLAQKLGAPPHGYERVILDGDVLLIHAATRIVVDVVRDVVRSG